MTEKRGLELTDAQQLLLCRYFDNECTCVGRFLAQRLLKTRVEAREYLDGLKLAGISCRDALSNEGVADLDLWDKIEARIEAEERAALFLGERRLSHQDDGVRMRWGSRVSTSQVFLGGLSGAAVTAMTLLLITAPSERGDYPTISTGGAQLAANQFTQTSLNNVSEQKGFRTRPVLLNDASSSTSAMEVDWMRANGPLRFIQNPGQRSAIIWVTKKNRSSALPNRTSASVSVTPTVALSPSEGLDGSLFSSSK